VILVGEARPFRVKNLISQEKKRIARLVGDTPILTYRGQRRGQLPLRRCSTT